MFRTRKPLGLSWLCLGASVSVKQDRDDVTSPVGECSWASSRDFAAEVSSKEAGATTPAAAGTAYAVSLSSGIPAVYEPSSRHGGDMRSTDCPSTSYPTNTSYGEEWDALGACMTTATEMEACVDAVLEGSIKSAQTLFARYDMDLDCRLKAQDYYDLMLELNLALPYQDYQRFVDATFGHADVDRDGLLTIDDFIPLYKSIAAVRRAFRRQDHHSNGQIDRYDFHQLLLALEEFDGRDGKALKALADGAFSMADSHGRGIVNFGQVLVWYGTHLAANKGQQQQQQQQ